MWVSHPRLSGAELAARLGIRGIIVAAGDALGEPGHVRITLPVVGAVGRLVEALEAAVREGLAGGRAGLAQQRLGGALEDLAPGADLFVLFVEVLDHLAQALG